MDDSQVCEHNFSEIQNQIFLNFILYCSTNKCLEAIFNSWFFHNISSRFGHKTVSTNCTCWWFPWEAKHRLEVQLWKCRRDGQRLKRRVRMGCYRRNTLDLSASWQAIGRAYQPFPQPHRTSKFSSRRSLVASRQLDVCANSECDSAETDKPNHNASLWFLLRRCRCTM